MNSVNSKFTVGWCEDVVDTVEVVGVAGGVVGGFDNASGAVARLTTR